MTHEEFINRYVAGKRWYVKDGILYIDRAFDCLLTDITNISELPDNLHIKSYLDVQRTKITKLPENLYIGSMLYYGDSLITELPDSIIFGNDNVRGSFNMGQTLLMCEKVQLTLISHNKYNFCHIKNPTKKAIVLNNLLWKI